MQASSFMTSLNLGSAERKKKLQQFEYLKKKELF